MYATSHCGAYSALTLYVCVRILTSSPHKQTNICTFVCARIACCCLLACQSALVVNSCWNAQNSRAMVTRLAKELAGKARRSGAAGQVKRRAHRVTHNIHTHTKSGEWINRCCSATVDVALCGGVRAEGECQQQMCRGFGWSNKCRHYASSNICMYNTHVDGYI